MASFRGFVEGAAPARVLSGAPLGLDEQGEAFVEALAHARGDTAQAAALLDEARAAFQALGMPALVEPADHLAREWAAHAGDAAVARLSPVA